MVVSDSDLGRGRQGFAQYLGRCWRRRGIQGYCGQRVPELLHTVRPQRRDGATQRVSELVDGPRYQAEYIHLSGSYVEVLGSDDLPALV